MARLRRQALASRVCQPVNADPITWAAASGIPCDEADRVYAWVDDRLAVGAAVRELSPRDQRVLALRYTGELSQAQIAERLGVSQMQVSRILRSMLARLRGQLN